MFSFLPLLRCFICLFQVSTRRRTNNNLWYARVQRRRYAEINKHSFSRVGNSCFYCLFCFLFFVFFFGPYCVCLHRKTRVHLEKSLKFIIYNKVRWCCQVVIDVVLVIFPCFFWGGFYFFVLNFDRLELFQDDLLLTYLTF